MSIKTSGACQASPAYVHHTGAALVPRYTAQENGLCRKVAAPASPVIKPVRRTSTSQDIIPIFQQSSVFVDANALINIFVASAITSAGFLGFVDATQAVQFADALYLDKSIVVGVSVGVGNQFVVYGVYDHACFTTHGGMPQNGKPVWLASSTDEANAAGKLSATPCDVGFLVRVGTCIDNSHYNTQKKCKILFNPTLPFIL